MTALYKLVISKQVRKKDMPAILSKDRLRIVNMIGSLKRDPRPVQAKKLTNREEYRLRVGDYRILYIVADEIKVIEIRRVRHRREVYR